MFIRRNLYSQAVPVSSELDETMPQSTPTTQAISVAPDDERPA